MKTRTRIGLCALAIIFVIATSQTLAQTSLTGRWIQGEKLTYVLEDNYTSKSTVEQDFFELNQNLILDSTWHVKSVASKGEVEILVTIERVRFMADGKGAAAIIEQLKFDSNDQKEPRSRQEKGVFDALKAFVGSQI